MKLLDHMVVLIFFVTSILVGGSDRKVSAYNVGDPASIPGWGRSPGEGNGNPLHYSCQENPTDRGASQATVHGVKKSQTQLHDFTFTFTFHTGCTNLLHTNSHHLFLHIFPNALSLSCFMIAILTVVRCHLIMVLISLVISDVEQLFLYLWAICVSFWKNICSYPLPIF